MPSSVYLSVRLAFVLFVCISACAQDAREIVRKSVEFDQANWMRMADYTWTARLHERHFDGHDRVTSEHKEAWETLVLDGEPFRRMLERDGKALPPDEQRKEQQKLDKETAKLAKSTPEQKQRRAAELEKERRHDREFLLELPDAFDLKIDGEDKIDGRDVWVISGMPKPGYHPKTHDGAALLKIRGKMWIDKQDFQWVRVEAETTATISWGLFLARLNPGAKLVLEQTRVNDEVWLPKREYVVGNGRIGLVKRLSEDQEITWNDYKKFQVESKIVVHNQ